MALPSVRKRRVDRAVLGILMGVLAGDYQSAHHLYPPVDIGCLRVARGDSKDAQSSAHPARASSRRDLERLSTEANAGGPRMTDAVLAALAVEHGAKLASTDRDFARFPGLAWVNPLS